MQESCKDEALADTYCKHQQESFLKGNIPSQRGSCIDQTNGIFLVRETPKGVQHPENLQMLNTADAIKMYCESAQCDHKSAVKAMGGK